MQGGPDPLRGRIQYEEQKQQLAADSRMASWKVISVLYLMYLEAFGLTQSLSPPTIIQHPNIEITFKAGEKVEIPCRAKGEPAPTYKWKKNDELLTINNIHIKQVAGIGTIVINEPNNFYEGVYQCIATNNFGSALSIKTILKRAVLEPFPPVKQAQIHRPVVGTPLTLHCQPPFSYPQALVYWGESKTGDRLKPIDSDERISLDYEGNLYFANVLAEDARGGVSYLCIVQNMELRSLVQGNDRKISPESISGKPRNEPPRLMWPMSSASEVALKGEPKKMKCIFSGFPTPTVNWTRVDAPLPSNVIIDSYGQEITIPDTDYTDVGTYKCTGTNLVSESSRLVTLRVESPPYWRNGRRPEDVYTSEEESARFDCLAIGQPKPEIAWFINGIPVEDLPTDQRRSIGRDYLIYRNVTKSDAQVIQCNASNIHGYIFSNAFLNPIGPPDSSPDSLQTQTVPISACCTSHATILWTSADVEPNVHVLSAGWFIGLSLCAIALVLLIPLLICLVKRNRGGKTAVHMENLRGLESSQHDGEIGFGEYTRTEAMNKSRGPMENKEKPGRLDKCEDSARLAKVQ